MSLLVQLLLLLTSVFHCITLGNALKCRKAGTDDEDPGSPPGECEALPSIGFCYVTVIHYNNNLSVFYGCGRNGFASCDSEKFYPSTKMWSRTLCCSNKDFCNYYVSSN